MLLAFEVKASMLAWGARSSWANGAAALVAAATTLALPPDARAYHEGEERIIDQTAHTLRAREMRIGIWDVDFGPVSFVTLGTDTAPWLAGFVLPSVVANGHAKLRFLRTEPFTLSVAAAVYHAKLGMGPLAPSGGALWLVPVSVLASSDLSPRVSLHLGVTYTDATVNGDPDLEASGTTAIVARALQLHAAAEYRVSRLVALLFRVRGEAWATPATLRTSTVDDDGGRVDFFGTVDLLERTAVAATGALALSGPHLNLRVGLGYGALFLPSMGVRIPIATVLPELDAYVRF